MDLQQLQAFADAATEAARLGGEELVSRMGTAAVSQKGPRDLVTEADFASQRVIHDLLIRRFPDHQFLGEESTEGADGDFQDGFCWIVDPLDGTTNYVHQLPSFSVSIGLYDQGEPLVGVVWDPILKEMFVAQNGQGASLNDQPIGVSHREHLEDAMVVISLSKAPSRKDTQTEILMRLLETAGSVRRLGSAALNFCYVAMGRIDCYWGNGLKPWDVAAGSLIAKEAGAVLSQSDGQPFRVHSSRFVCSANDSIEEQILELVQSG